jgi:serine O-acetyltransferase
MILYSRISFAIMGGGGKIGLREKTQLFGYRYTTVLRKTHYWKNKNKIMYLLYAYKLNKLQIKYGFQISTSATIGKGLYLGHVGTIVVNPQTILGDNVNLSPNVVIGKQNRGEKKGAPQIGSSVWIGSGAVIVGKITIGDDVLIAPNAYVNFDVPSHSIVIGNPGNVIRRENATEGYVVNKV